MLLLGGIIYLFFHILITGDIMNTDKRREDVVKRESGLHNIYIDCNSKEGKMLIEVVEKESSLKKLKEK